MPTAEELIQKIKSLANEKAATLQMKHGAKQPCYGVKIEELKKLQKLVRNNHDLAMELFSSGVFDAMYLAGLIMNGSTMSREELNAWADTNYGSSISSHTVPWVASENPAGMELALNWIDSPQEFVAVSGWATISAIVSIRPDQELDLPLLASLLDRVEAEIHAAPNRVRQAMNNYLICLGSYVTPLTSLVVQTADRVGRVKVDVGDTDCTIPLATEYIFKVQKRGTLGKKRKTAKC